MDLKIEFLNNEKNNEKIKDDIFLIYQDLKSKFKIDLDFLFIRIHDSRDSYNSSLNIESSETWMIGNANDNGEIDLVSQSVIEEEKYHKKEEFYSLIKHEIVHLFVSKITNNSAVPFWLNEGLAEFIGYNEKNELIGNYFYNNFFDSISSKKDWNNLVNNMKCYQISSCFVGFIIDRYSFEKILELLKKLSKNYYYPDFKLIFKDIFNIEFEDLEKEFIRSV